MSKHHPPTWANYLLEWFCAPHLLEEVQGDLQELYGKWVKKHGVKKAQWLYMLHSIKFFRPYSIKRLSINNPTDMLKNYVKIAFRNLLRQKGYSLLNISGLSVGLACTFFLTLWIRDEVSYDRFHESGDQLYRVMRHVYSGDEIRTSDQVTWNIAHTLKEEYPEVEDVAIVTTLVNLVMQHDEISMREYGIYASPSFFEMFTWHLIQGEPTEVLQDPKSIVISASLAEKYFGDDWRVQAVGGIIHDKVYGLGDFTVTGIFEDITFIRLCSLILYFP